MASVSAHLPPRLSYAGLALGFAALAVLLWHTPLNHDSAYLMLAAARYLDGLSLYADQSMANPPLTTWMHAGVMALDRAMGALLGEALEGTFGEPPGGLFGGLFGLRALIVAVLLGVVLVLALSGRILACIPELDRRTRARLLLAAFVAVAATPLRDFAQRDHLFALFTFPYVLVMGVRYGGHVLPRALGLAVGAVAFLGIALKPHFVLLPVVLELAWLARTRHATGRWKAALRPETLVLTGLLIAYGAGVLALYPEYFDTVLPRYARVFSAFTQPLTVLAVQPEVVIALVALLACARAGRRHDHAPAHGMILAGALACAAALAIYFLQKKGWSYQRAPALVFATWVLAALALSAGLRLWSSVGLGLAVALVAVRGPYANVYRDTTAQAIAAAAGTGGTAYVFTSNVSVPYPGLPEAGVEPASRFNTLWMVPAIARARTTDPHALQDIERFARRALVEDFTRRRPDAVAVDGREPKPYFNGVPFDYLDWALEDQRFARIWSSYVFLRRAYGFDIYVRTPGDG